MKIKLARRHITVSEYYQMAKVGIIKPTENLELIRGEIIIKEKKTAKHIGCVIQLTHKLTTLLTQKAIVSVQNPITLNHFSEPEPDITILKLKDDFYASEKAGAEDVLLLIEVADSTLLTDREIKIPLYAEADIPECWIVDLENQVLEIYKNPSQGIYKIREIKHLEDDIHFPLLEMTVKTKDLIG